MLLWDAVAEGRISANRFVEIVSTAPAKLFGLYPGKGAIAPGSDADLVLIDPKGKKTISYKDLHMKVDYNPYEGKTLRGCIRHVFIRGEQVVSEGRFIGKTTHGRFLKRPPRSFN